MVATMTFLHKHGILLCNFKEVASAIPGKFILHQTLYWNHKINQKQQTANDMEFAEVTSIISNTHDSDANQGKSEDFQLVLNDIQVTVPSNFNQDSLLELMKVLKQL